MNPELARQQNYWDRTSRKFDSIYSHDKSRLANWLDGIFRWDMYERFDYTMKRSEPIEGRSFLDVGCGTGRYALELADKGARKVVGLDIADEMVKTCEDRARAVGLANRTLFVRTDLLQFRPETRFDIAIGIGLFDYVRNPLPVLTKMRESASDRAILSFPRAGTWRAFVRRIRLGLLGCDVYFYSEQRIRGLLDQAGFKRYDAVKIGQLYCVTAYVE
jgi:SAM-dependent methyltransferase